MHLGCEVTLVSSGQECLQVISQPGQLFNVLLLDVCMADMDGYEVAIHIQEKFARHECPLLIALTRQHRHGNLGTVFALGHGPGHSQAHFTGEDVDGVDRTFGIWISQ